MRNAHTHKHARPKDTGSSGGGGGDGGGNSRRHSTKTISHGEKIFTFTTNIHITSSVQSTIQKIKCDCDSVVFMAFLTRSHPFEDEKNNKEDDFLNAQCTPNRPIQ